MPHFVVDCSENVLLSQDGDTITERVHIAASSTELFSESNIQVRVNAFQHHRIGNKKEDFIQVFAHILEGRTTEQKVRLSKSVIATLSEMFPDVATIGIDIIDLEKGTGFNKTMF